MSCERYAVAITDHACGAGIEPDALVHLEACGRCRTRFEKERRALGDLDAALRDALAIEASPGFERAVLARIERRETSRPRTMLWTVLAAAAVALIAVGLSFLRTSQPQEVKPTEQAVRTTPKPAPVNPPVQPETPQAPSVASATPTTPTPPVVVRQSRARKPLPTAEVIVAADQREMFERYMSLVRTGKIDTTSLRAQAEIEDEPPAIVVAPLTLEPLNVPAVEIVRSPSLEGRGRE